MGVSSKVLFPISLLLFAGLASADVNLFNWTGITIVSPTNPAIAPWSGTCPPYPESGCNVSSTMGNYPDGFPLLNMFGEGEQTMEGVPDAIFDGTSTSQGQMYDNVYFTMNNNEPISYIGNIFVDGAQDGPQDNNRSFSEFLLWTYTDVNDPSTYKLLYAGVPLVSPTGSESLEGYVGATNVGPNFVAQFYTNSGSGVRVFDVIATAPEPAEFLAGVPLMVLAGCSLFARRRRARA
jgi:hypothetical protein